MQLINYLLLVETPKDSNDEIKCLGRNDKLPSNGGNEEKGR
jgi:hypothetical protein